MNKKDHLYFGLFNFVAVRKQTKQLQAVFCLCATVFDLYFKTENNSE